ncbi:alpha/beta hydrolase [Corynebacterium epidermidicanis]|nr:alpha/beta hydrolase family protein [Corynebacterium epidermidicanis]
MSTLGLVIGLTVAAPSASAQSSQFQPGGVLGSSALTGLSAEPTKPLHASSEAMFSSPLVAQGGVNALLSSLAIVGSSELPVFGSTFVEPPFPTVPGITRPKVVEKRQEDRAERWIIASPAMEREVEVLVRPARSTTATAPVLYLLDGVDAKPAGEWLSPGDAAQFGDDVTLVMPTQARASLWMDWDNDDPVLGRNKWETFLTEELPGLVEAQPEVRFNGKRAIGGISMGANAAVMIANLNPGRYDAVFGISGCYSTLDDIGHQITNLMVSSRGGNLDNVWGPFGSPGWQRHDVVSDPSGLAGTRMYLSAGSGVINDAEREFFYNATRSSEIALSATLEAGVRTCTQRLEREMNRHDLASNARFAYSDRGAHTWMNFNTQVGPAWEYIRPALY